MVARVDRVTPGGSWPFQESMYKGNKERNARRRRNQDTNVTDVEHALPRLTDFHCLQLAGFGNRRFCGALLWWMNIWFMVGLGLWI